MSAGGLTQGIARVLVTDAALDLIETLRRKTPTLLFHQSGGCCDGSAPMLFDAREFLTGDSDVQLGEIGGVPFWMSRSQFDYWRHTQLIIDVVPGIGGMFSLESGSGLRFLTRSRLFSEQEWALVQQQDRQSGLG